MSFFKKNRGLSILTKTTIAVSISLIVATTMLSVISIRQQSKILEEEIFTEKKMLAELSALAAESALVNFNPASFKTMIKEITKKEDVKYCYIVKPDGKIFMADDSKVVGKKIANKAIKTRWTVIQNDPSLGAKGEGKVVITPIPAGSKRWTLWIGFSTARSKAIQTQMLHSFLRMTILIVLLGFLISLLLVREINYPLKQLIKGVRAVASGNLTYQVKVKTKDEIGQLATSFNKMAQELRISRDKLQKVNLTLEQKVQERTEQLTILNEKLRVANQKLEMTNKELQLKNDQLEEKTKRLLEAQKKLVQSEKLAALGQLASSVGHELRNPLGVIKTAVYYIKSKIGQGNPKVLKHLRIIEKEINSSNKIITDLLDFSRTREPLLKLTNLNRLIEDILSVTQLPQNLKLIKNLSTNLPEIPIDEDQIRQIFINLTLNAIQAMPDSGKLKIASRERMECIEVEFTDTGCGITKENLKRLFDPFFTTKPKGIGLGLAVVKRIIEKHNGSIQVKSKPGEGSTFTVKLPLKKEEK